MLMITELTEKITIDEEKYVNTELPACLRRLLSIVVKKLGHKLRYSKLQVVYGKLVRLKVKG